MPQQTTCHFRLKYHRYLAGIQTTRAQAGHGPFRRLAPHTLRRFETGWIAGDGIPVIPLHTRLILPNQGTTQTMAGTEIMSPKTVAVTIYPQAIMAADRSPFRITDTWIRLPSGRFTFLRQGDRLLGIDMPGMIQIEIKDLGRHHCGICQPGIGIFFRETGNITSCLYSFANCLGTEVTCARGSFAFSHIHSNTQAFVTVMLKGINFAKPDID